MTRPRLDTELVHFKGPWRSEQQDLLSDAIEEYETARTGSQLYGQVPEWVCVAYDMGQSQLFCAHRPHLATVLTGQTARDLALSIRESA